LRPAAELEHYGSWPPTSSSVGARTAASGSRQVRSAAARDDRIDPGAGSAAATSAAAHRCSLRNNQTGRLGLCLPLSQCVPRAGVGPTGRYRRHCFSRSSSCERRSKSSVPVRDRSAWWPRIGCAGCGGCSRCRVRTARMPSRLRDGEMAESGSRRLRSSPRHPTIDARRTRSGGGRASCCAACDRSATTCSSDTWENSSYDCPTTRPTSATSGTPARRPRTQLLERVADATGTARMTRCALAPGELARGARRGTGGDAVVDDDHRSPLQRQRWRPPRKRRTAAPVPGARCTRPPRTRGGDARVSDNPLVDHQHLVLTDGAHCQFRLERHAQLAHDQDVQRAHNATATS